MLNFKNIEGDAYNAFIDQYLVLEVNDYKNTEYNQIEQLMELVEASHCELILIETQSHGLDLIEFLENIEKIVIFKKTKSCNTYHVTVQKPLLSSLLDLI